MNKQKSIFITTIALFVGLMTPLSVPSTILNPSNVFALDENNNIVFPDLYSLNSETNEVNSGNSVFESGSNPINNTNLPQSKNMNLSIVTTNNNNSINDDYNILLTCEECFTTYLNEEQIEEALIKVEGIDLANYCDRIGQDTTTITEELFREGIANLGVSEENIDLLIECLTEAGIVFV